MHQVHLGVHTAAPNHNRNHTFRRISQAERGSQLSLISQLSRQKMPSSESLNIRSLSLPNETQCSHKGSIFKKIALMRDRWHCFFPSNTWANSSNVRMPCILFQRLTPPESPHLYRGRMFRRNYRHRACMLLCAPQAAWKVFGGLDPFEPCRDVCPRTAPLPLDKRDSGSCLRNMKLLTREGVARARHRAPPSKGFIPDAH